MKMSQFSAHSVQGGRCGTPSPISKIHIALSPCHACPCAIQSIPFDSSIHWKCPKCHGKKCKFIHNSFVRRMQTTNISVQNVRPSPWDDVILRHRLRLTKEHGPAAKRTNDIKMLNSNQFTNPLINMDERVAAFRFHFALSSALSSRASGGKTE